MAYSRPRAPRPSALAVLAFSAWTAWAVPGRAAAGKLLKGPYLTGLSDSTVEVRFEGDVPSGASVEVRSEPLDGGVRTFQDGAATTMHVVRVGGLEAAGRYGYVVRLGGTLVGQGHFATAPKPDSGTPLTFSVYGDDRTDPVAHAAVVRALASSHSDVLVNTGDLVEDGGRATDWQTFFDVEAPLLRDRALFVAIGNHELFQDSAGANFARYFGFFDSSGAEHVFGTVRLSNVRFFFLNAMHDWEGGEERRWLEQELARADDEPGLVWRVAVVHHGPWSSGPHGPNANLIAARVPELLQSHKVDLILSGHDHIYERGVFSSMKYVVSGGGGAPLYRVGDPVAGSRKAESTYHFVELTTGADAIRLVARRIDGSTLDRCGFKKGFPWDCDFPAGATPGTSDTPPPRAQGGPASARCGCSAVGPRRAPPVTAAPVWVVCLVGMLCAARARARRSRRGGPLRPVGGAASRRADLS